VVELVHQAEDEGKIVRIPMGLADRTFTRGLLEDLDGMPVYSIVAGPDRLLELAVKRALDIVGALVGLVVLSPIMAVVTLAILVRDGRPILFTQERVGLHGRTFRILKFRTMVPDAEARLSALLDHNERNGHAFKMTNDPRVTPLGRTLRRTSLDELPQLWNVLRGEMSLVGPRPPLPREVAEYDGWHRRRLSMKPGMTGLWQIEARHAPDFDAWVERDLAYIDSWSLLLDLRILARTVPAVLAGTGR
jgi:exopolysaccharide biosynthesis polyprenyl glycosylphosphotransferase